MSDLQVPIELVAQAIEEQRNTALTEAAQYKALARHLKTENDQLRADLEKLRPTGDDASPSSANGATSTRTATPTRT